VFKFLIKVAPFQNSSQMNYEKLNMEIEEMTEQYEKKIDDYEETKIGK
jgi:uncharacterized protein YeeX (DUF496 family)